MQSLIRFGISGVLATLTHAAVFVLLLVCLDDDPGGGAIGDIGSEQVLGIWQVIPIEMPTARM